MIDQAPTWADVIAGVLLAVAGFLTGRWRGGKRERDPWDG